MAISKILILSTILPLAFAVDWTTIQSDLQAIDTTIRSSTTDCLNYDGSSQSVLKYVFLDIYTYSGQVQNATRDCQNAVGASVTAAQANSVNDYLISPFEPDNRALTNCIVSQTGPKSSQSQYAILKQNLKWLQANTTNFHNCLNAKTPTAQKAATSSITSKINANIQNAVNAYP